MCRYFVRKRFLAGPALCLPSWSEAEPLSSEEEAEWLDTRSRRSSVGGSGVTLMMALAAAVAASVTSELEDSKRLRGDAGGLGHERSRGCIWQSLDMVAGKGRMDASEVRDKSIEGAPSCSVRAGVVLHEARSAGCITN